MLVSAAKVDAGSCVEILPSYKLRKYSSSYSIAICVISNSGKCWQHRPTKGAVHHSAVDNKSTINIPFVDIPKNMFDYVPFEDFVEQNIDFFQENRGILSSFLYNRLRTLLYSIIPYNIFLDLRNSCREMRSLHESFHF